MIKDTKEMGTGGESFENIDTGWFSEIRQNIGAAATGPISGAAIFWESKESGGDHLK